MRKQLVTSVEKVIEENPDVVLLLGDIGVFGFRNTFQNYPSKIYNIGILEQSTVSMAAGLAKVGLIPIVHTIAPFLIERCLEQLKIDFGYQALNGNFISVGASYDYAALGCTHHCPGDVQILQSIPGMQIIVPGTSSEFNLLFWQCFNNGCPTYFRLSEKENEISLEVEFGKANVLKKGSLATIIVVGPLKDRVFEACLELDVTIIYYTTVMPFDRQTLLENLTSNKIILCEPYYVGTSAGEILNALRGKAISFELIGVPREFLTNYGKPIEHDSEIGLTIEKIYFRIKSFIYG
jgi:transketolase